jgi:hypothetical protein
MLNRRLGSLAFVLVATAAGLWACGSGDDSSGTNTGGSGGKASGGSAGQAGASAGKGGGGSGGVAVGGSGGATAGTSGSSGAGMAGVSSGGEAGGDIGAGGFSLADACAAMCASQASMACSLGANCVQDCTESEAETTAPTKYDAMIACEAQNLTSASDYNCSDMGPVVPSPAPNNGTACQTVICDWTCDDGDNNPTTIVDANVYGYCGCT